MGGTYNLKRGSELEKKNRVRSEGEFVPIMRESFFFFDSA